MREQRGVIECHTLFEALWRPLVNDIRMTVLPARSRNAETVAKIDTAHVFVLNHFFGATGHKYFAIVQDIGPVDDFERFTHIMVSDENTDSALFQIGDKMPDIPN